MAVLIEAEQVSGDSLLAASESDQEDNKKAARACELVHNKLLFTSREIRYVLHGSGASVRRALAHRSAGHVPNTTLHDADYHHRSSFSRPYVHIDIDCRPMAITSPYRT